MRQHDPDLKETVVCWLGKASKDLRTCRLVLENDSALGSVAAFHAQQAAEKCMKALLTWHQVLFTKTHDLGLLLELLAKLDPSLLITLHDVIKLTDFAVDVRYPGDIPEISNEEARAMLDLALRVQQEILTRLPREFGNAK